jgi:SAM-dependent methyltransferase
MTSGNASAARTVLSELDSGIDQLIRQALQKNIASYSSLNGIVTGNAYQAVRLRGEVMPGFRRPSEGMFAGLQLEGRRIVDLGCNLGEHSRLAACANAAFVEGIEYEELFVRIAGLVNVFNRINNILIRQGDITQPGCLTKKYDIGLCFSAYVYVRENIKEITENITRMLVFETHALDQGWFRYYVEEVSRYLPYWIIYGFSDHGAKLKVHKRACIAFARERDEIAEIAERRAIELNHGLRHLIDIDISASPRVVSLCGRQTATRAAFADLRQSLADRPGISTSAVVDLLVTVAGELDQHRRPIDDNDFASDLYWSYFFKGLAEYLAGYPANPKNTYVSYLMKLSEAGNYDPAMREILADEAVTRERMRWRFDTFVEILRTKAVRTPVIVYNAMSRVELERQGLSVDHREPEEFVVDRDGNRYWTAWVDGHHRLAALYLSGAEFCSSLFAWSNLHPLDLRGETAATSEAAPGDASCWGLPAVGRVVEATVSLCLADRAADAAAPA